MSAKPVSVAKAPPPVGKTETAPAPREHWWQLKLGPYNAPTKWEWNALYAGDNGGPGSVAVIAVYMGADGSPSRLQWKFVDPVGTGWDPPHDIVVPDNSIHNLPLDVFRKVIETGMDAWVHLVGGPPDPPGFNSFRLNADRIPAAQRTFAMATNSSVTLTMFAQDKKAALREFFLNATRKQ